jgi:hypothetical protein
MHYGTICLEGLGCAAENPPGNRNLADFFQVTHDPRSGAVSVVYDDTSNELKQHTAPGAHKPPEQVDHRGAPVVTVLRQTGGVGVFGRPIRAKPSRGRTLRDRARDARWDPLYGGARVPQLDIRSVRMRLRGRRLLFRLGIRSLADPTAALTKTRATAIDYVIRWSGPRKRSPARFPVHYAAVELVGSSGPAFFAGTARSLELCSVSGCFPHFLEYARPPQGGKAVRGHKAVVTGRHGRKHYFWVISVPRKVVGAPRRGSRLQSVGAYAFARNKSASAPITNSEAQAGLLPILVDGACCKNMRVRR